MEPYIRKSDGLILVCQNNEEQTLMIKEVNPILCDITGRTVEELIDAPLHLVLGKRLRDSLDDYLEYEDDAHDVQAVLTRVHGFQLQHKGGAEVDVTCKIVRSTAYDKHQWFRLIIKDEHVRREEDARRTILVENFRGHEQLDPELGIPDYESLAKNLELVTHYVQGNSLQAVYALVRFDGYSQFAEHDKQLAAEALIHMISTIRRTLRPDDTVCRAADDGLGLILSDITLESARIVLNRLRWAIISDRFVVKGGMSHTMNVSVAYKSVGSDGGTGLLSECKDRLDTITTPNAMIELS